MSERHVVGFVLGNVYGCVDQRIISTGELLGFGLTLPFRLAGRCCEALHLLRHDVA
ncbi:Uncharacterised protein [Escherichia coli]|nr:Uncharacterised protein [Escherichia coli]